MNTPVIRIGERRSSIESARLPFHTAQSSDLTSRSCHQPISVGFVSGREQGQSIWKAKPSPRWHDSRISPLSRFVLSPTQRANGYPLGFSRPSMGMESQRRQALLLGLRRTQPIFRVSSVWDGAAAGRWRSCGGRRRYSAAIFDWASRSLADWTIFSKTYSAGR